MHLLYTNTILLLDLVSAGNLFEQALRILFALSYSLMTVLIIAVYPKWYVYSISAILDGFAVWLKYFEFSQESTFVVLASIYFALYTSYIVVISGQIAKQKEKKEKERTEILKAFGFNGKSETVYKLLTDYEESLQKSLARAQGSKRTEREEKLKLLQQILKPENTKQR